MPFYNIDKYFPELEISCSSPLSINASQKLLDNVKDSININIFHNADVLDNFVKIHIDMDQIIILTHVLHNLIKELYKPIDDANVSIDIGSIFSYVTGELNIPIDNSDIFLQRLEIVLKRNGYRITDGTVYGIKKIDIS